jgi:hypothetical protein
MQPERSFENDRHLEGLPENLRRGDPGRRREAIRATIANTMVGEDGTLALTVKPEGLLGGPDSHCTFRVPGERHQGCAHGLDWAEILAWKVELPLPEEMLADRLVPGLGDPPMVQRQIDIGAADMPRPGEWQE